MMCFFCGMMEASAKIGSSQGNIWAALVPNSIRKKLSWKVWDKQEVYSCHDCYVKLKGVYQILK